MFRIDHVTATDTMPQVEELGVAGFFTKGDPNSTPPKAATRVTQDWLNDKQEELCHVVEYFLGENALDKADQTKLRQAIQAAIAANTPSINTLSDVDTTGISLGQILKFDGTNFVPFNLPAIDAETRNLAMTAFIKANILSSDPAGKQGNVIADDFKSDTLAIKTGATYESEGYINAAIGTVDITNPALTINSGFGYHETGAPEVAFDDDVNVGTGTLNFGASAVGAWIGQNFPTAKDIRKIRFYRDNAAADTTSWLIKFSDDGVTWTTVTTVSGLSVTGWHEIEIPAVGAHTHWIMVVNAIRQDGTNWPVHIPEIEMFEFMAQDMHLQSNAVQLDTANPTDISAFFLVTDTDTVINGTDRVVSLSIDGGTTFTTATVTSSWTYEAGKRLVRFDADVSGQVGDQLVWKLETFNTKLQKIEHFSALPVNY